MQELAIKNATANAFYRYDSKLFFAAKVWFQSFKNISKLFIQFPEHFLRCKYLRGFNEAICTNTIEWITLKPLRKFLLVKELCFHFTFCQFDFGSKWWSEDSSTVIILRKSASTLVLRGQLSDVLWSGATYRKSTTLYLPLRRPNRRFLLPQQLRGLEWNSLRTLKLKVWV